MMNDQHIQQLKSGDRQVIEMRVEWNDKPRLVWFFWMTKNPGVPAVRQFEDWGRGEQGSHLLIAASRFIAAHTPTERQNLHTGPIARRQQHGAALCH